MDQGDNPTASGSVRVTLQSLMDRAQTARHQGEWTLAASLYQTILSAGQQIPEGPVLAAIHHNLAVSLFALRQFDEALVYADRAQAMQPTWWQAGLLGAQASRLIQTPDLYIERVLKLHAQHPDNPQIQLMQGQMMMNYLGNAKAAREVLAPLLDHPVQGREAQAVSLMSRLYDRDVDDSAESISRDVTRFAARHLTLDPHDVAAVTPAEQWKLPKPATLRIGVVSSLLNASPVHALGIRRMRQWHEAGHELVFYQRGSRTDWATAELRQLATHWIDAVGLSAAQLHVCLVQGQLDELYEMGGWMDLDSLRAVSIKPSKRLYKWVGGQNCTTGLTSFDGFISDSHQSPADCQALYAEPLLIEPGSYVSYTPPVYVQPFKNKALGLNTGRWGVIANPVKLSRAFLDWLLQLGRSDLASVFAYRSNQTTVVSRLVLVDYRYAVPAVRERVESVLRPVWGDRLQFVAPIGHPAFMDALADLQGLIDTFPYSCGLTMIEGLYVGLDVCFPDVSRRLFCERHGLAHVLHYLAGAPEGRT